MLNLVFQSIHMDEELLQVWDEIIRSPHEDDLCVLHNIITDLKVST